MMKPKVYFTRRTDKEGLLELYQRLGVTLEGNVAVKLHSGEKGNQNYVRPEFVRPLIELVQGTVVECNTAYDGARNSRCKSGFGIGYTQWYDNKEKLYWR